MPNTREKLIDAIEKEKPYIPTEDYEVGYNNGLTMAQSIILATDNNVGHKWIPVTERLPDKDGAYLVRWDNKSVGDAEYESKHRSFGYWLDIMWDGDADWYPYTGITHWMPLPEPPKGE